jgi:hypothetical protein
MGKNLNKLLSPLAPNTRVKVADAGLNDYLGEGTFLGYVSVFYFEFPSYIKGTSEPEHLPKYREIVDAYNNDGILKYHHRMPKIRLDSGKILYGIDCWFSANQGEGDFKKWMVDYKKRKDEQLRIITAFRNDEINITKLKEGLKASGLSNKSINYIQTSEEVRKAQAKIQTRYIDSLVS